MATETIKIVDPDSGAGYDYASLAAWESARARNLVSADEQETAKCRSTSGSADATALSMSTSWTTDATRFIKIWTDTAESYRHPGYWDTSKYRLDPSSSGTCLTIVSGGPDDVYIIGLQFTPSGTSANGISLVASTSAEIYIEQCIIKGVNANFASGITDTIGAGGILRISNCVVYDFNGNSGSGIYTNTATKYYFNNTVQNCAMGLRTGYQTAKAVNCIAQDCGDGFWGTWASGSDYNLSDIASDAPGGSSVQSTLTFANKAGDDFHLDSTDTAAIGAGYDLSGDGNYPISIDIDGTTRSSWDIGADEYESSGQTINLDLLTLASSAKSLTVTPGAVSLTMDLLGLTAAAQSLTINQSVNLDLLAITAAAPSLTINFSVNMGLLSMTAAAQSLTVTPGAVSLDMDLLALTSAALASSITPGPVSVAMDLLTLEAYPYTSFVWGTRGGLAPLDQNFLADRSGYVQKDGAVYTAAVGWDNCKTSRNETTGVERRCYMAFDTSPIPDDATLMKVEFYQRLRSSQPAGEPGSRVMQYYLGQFIGSTLDGDAGEWTGGSQVHELYSVVDDEWIELGNVDDAINYVYIDGQTDLKIVDASVQGGGSSSWATDYNDTKERCQLRVTYGVPGQIDMNVVTMTFNALGLKIDQAVLMDALGLTAAAQSATITPGEVQILMDLLNIDATAQIITVENVGGGAVEVALNALGLTASALTLMVGIWEPTNLRVYLVEEQDRTFKPFQDRTYLVDGADRVVLIKTQDRTYLVPLDDRTKEEN